MKKLLLALLCLSTPAMAGGKVVVQSFKSAAHHELKIPSLVGLSIYDKVVGNVYYENFTSYSNSTVEDFVVNAKNINTKHMAHMHIGNLIVGAGIQAVVFLPKTSESDFRIVAQASYKLW